LDHPTPGRCEHERFAPICPPAAASPDGNFRVAWLEYPVRADGSWQGQWRIPTLPGRIGYGPGFQLRPSCVILSYRGRSKYDEGVQGVFAYDVQRLTIKPPM
jgi:hypothetical protein